MVLEGIITTLNVDSTTNVSPMGPLVEQSKLDRFVLRPFQSSTTYMNLKRAGEGVLHVTDNVLMLAQGAIGKLTDDEVELRPAEQILGRVLVDACRWYEFCVTELDDSTERTTIQCQVVHRGTQREFFGFNRAKHAVVEAAILATRIQFLEPEYIATEFERLSVIVGKTAGGQERAAFHMLDSFVTKAMQS